MELAGSVGLSGQVLTSSGPGATPVWSSAGSSMVYPSAGIPSSTGTAWGASYSVTGSGSVVLSTSPTLVTPALGTPASGNFSTGTFTWPTFNQNTSGNAATATLATTATTANALNTSNSYTVNGLTVSSTLTIPNINGGQIAGFRNWVLNRDMSVAQAGTSFSLPASGSYTLDGYQITGMSGDFTISQVAYTGNFQYALRVQRNSGGTSGPTSYVYQSFETRDVVKFAGKTMMFSFRARAGSNYSPTSSLLGIALLYGTGTDGNLYTVFTGQSAITSQNVTLTTSDQQFTVGPFTVPSNATQFGFSVGVAPTGTAGTNDYFDITGVQLEVGSVATPFEQITYQQNLMRCMRYRQVWGGQSPYERFGSGFWITSTSFGLSLVHQAPFRFGAKTLTYGGSLSSNYSITNGGSFTAASVGDSGEAATEVAFTGSGTSGTVAMMYANGTAAATLMLSNTL